MCILSFQQVDVFTDQPLKGNPLAVVVGADGLSDSTMTSLGNWTNLSETTFLLTPSAPTADYRVRIFTPERELPFAGHPTLGSCQVWLNSGGAPKQSYIVQECAAGLIRIKRDANCLAFAAPPLRRTGPVGTRLAREDRTRPAHQTPGDQGLAMGRQRSWLGRGNARGPRGSSGAEAGLPEPARRTSWRGRPVHRSRRRGC